MAKEENRTFDEAFAEVGDESTETVAVDTTDEEKESTTVETTEDSVPETTGNETVSDTKPAGETSEASWKDVGLEKYESMTREQIARDIHWRNKQMGDRANEIGELRKKVERLEQLQKNKDEEAEKPNLLDSIRDLTAAETEDFNRLYEASPVKAILKYGGDSIKDLVSGEVKKALGEHVPKAVTESAQEQQEALEFKQFLLGHDDADNHLPFMKVLDQEEHLGRQHRPLEELYQLAKLAKDKDPLYSNIYGLMHKHSAMTVAEARRFAMVMQKSPDTREKVKAEVAQIDKASTSASSTKRAADKVTKYDSIDAAFSDHANDEEE